MRESSESRAEEGLRVMLSALVWEALWEEEEEEVDDLAEGSEERGLLKAWLDWRGWVEDMVRVPAGRKR
jgi:hypothetical protein